MIETTHTLQPADEVKLQTTRSGITETQYLMFAGESKHGNYLVFIEPTTGDRIPVPKDQYPTIHYRSHGSKVIQHFTPKIS